MSMSTDATPPTAALALPDDPAVLRQMIQELLTTNHDLERELGQVRHRLDELLNCNSSSTP